MVVGLGRNSLLVGPPEHALPQGPQGMDSSELMMCSLESRVRASFVKGLTIFLVLSEGQVKEARRTHLVLGKVVASMRWTDYSVDVV